MKKLFLLIVLASCVSLLSDVSYAGYAEGNAFSSGNTNTNPAPDAYGQVVRIARGSRCKATAAPPSYSEGDEVPLSCELDGDLRTNATGGGGGGGDATAANQTTIIGHVDGVEGLLGTIDTGTSTTAPSAGTWYGLAAIMTGSAGSGTVKFVRFTPGTDTLATEDVGMFVGPSPTGTHKLLIGGRWNGALANPATGDYARAGVWSGVALTTDQLKTWFCTGVAASGGDGLWELAGTASPEPDSSGNGYDLTLSGTSAGSALTACPVAGNSNLMLMGVGR